MKIAVLILAHDNLHQLNRLIQHLHTNFDVFVHIDKKSPIKTDTIFKANNVHTLKKIRVYWGSYNQIKATLLLHRVAVTTNTYDRYVLISGSDIPIRSNTEIIQFFSQNKGKEFIQTEKLPWADWHMADGGFTRMREYHHIAKRGMNAFDKHIIRPLDKITVRLKKLFAPNRDMDYEFYGGGNWTNLTHSSVQFILDYLEHHPTYLARYKHTICADEIFFQTLVMLQKKVDIESSTLRYIDWKKGPEYPRTLTMEDRDAILSSKALFARKFDEKKDNEVIDALYKSLT